MALGQSSFRRILLSRLLLLCVPVLLMGVYVTYRKARSAFLESARQNLTESAVRTGESIHQSIESLKTNLITASDSVVLKLGSSKEQRSFLSQLATQLPTHIQCIQLIDLTTGQLTASTCGNGIIDSLSTNLWPRRQERFLIDPNSIYVKQLLPSSPADISSNNASQLELLLAAPVYEASGQLRYVLSIKSALLQKKKVEPGSLAGYPVVINEEGFILSHPFPKRVGRHISQEADAERLQSLIKGAIAGQQTFLHLFAFEKNGVEVVAGYSSIPSPVTRESRQKWIILAVTPLDAALSPLEEIQRVLFSLVFALIAASVLAMLYISRELARPLEKLRDYVLNKNNLYLNDPIPQNFRIREFNQLSIALNEMVDRLKAWGEEVVSAWKEAQNANHLKNQFLATTSHELRTPLNGIIGCIRVVRDGYCDNREEEMDFLRQADNAAVHLLAIINDILDIAKIEEGKLSVLLEPVDLKKILTEAINLQFIPIQQKGLTVNILMGKETIMVHADPGKLKQVFLNIISNAIKFTESGQIVISTRLVNDDPENSDRQKAIVIVKDTGIGIDPNQQKKLFLPFVMIDGSTTRRFGGTGLGLAISRNLIELMDGSITLFSLGLGRGTTVEISLPILATHRVPHTIAPSVSNDYQANFYNSEN
jgi:two-component system sensor histidine kinase BarA